MHELLVTECEIRQLIKDLPMGKASGYHSIDTEHIKFGGPLMVNVLIDLLIGTKVSCLSKSFQVWFTYPNS